jgi:hypothetical protein
MNASGFARYFTGLVSVGVEGGDSESGAGSRGEGMESQIAPQGGEGVAMARDGMRTRMNSMRTRSGERRRTRTTSARGQERLVAVLGQAREDGGRRSASADESGPSGGCICGTDGMTQPEEQEDSGRGLLAAWRALRGHKATGRGGGRRSYRWGLVGADGGGRLR